MYMNATRVVCRVKDFRRPERISAEVQLQNWVTSHTAATRQQYVLVDACIRASCEQLDRSAIGRYGHADIRAPMPI